MDSGTGQRVLDQVDWPFQEEEEAEEEEDAFGRDDSCGNGIFLVPRK